MRTLVALCFLAACGADNKSPPPPNDPPPPTDPAPPTGESPGDRPTLTAAECEARGGTVVGDIGDGAVHRSDYRCPNGHPPVATVPLGIEGSVCCAEASVCAAGGWPQPRGEMDANCQAVHDRCCYPSADAACSAAGCAAADCTIMKSLPVQVRCP